MSPDAADELLVEKIANGDIAAFQSLIERYQSLVLNVAYRFIGNSHDAEDIAQEAFLRLFRSAKRYKPTAKFKTWFFRIVTNLCLDFLKKKKPLYCDEFFNIPSASLKPAEELEATERQEILHRTLQTLVPNQRIVLLLHHYEGLRYKEIAEVMGCSVKAVESLLVRAKRVLKERLAPLL